MTRKLYYENVYQDTFEAAVLMSGVKNGRPYAILDATCFYPEGGGQACDTGVLGGIRVVDVQEEEGELRHYLESPLPEAERVTGKIDREGRSHRMQQHLGEHILAAVVKKLYNGNTVGVHFGQELNTLDFDIALSQGELRAAEEEVNAIIYRNAEVKTYFPDIADIKKRSRKAVPDSTELVRVVEIVGVDYIACCGTHPSHTGEVGLVKIFKQEAYKGGVRVFFSCGIAALRRLSRVWDNTADMQRALSIGDFELPVRLRKLIEDNKECVREKQALLQKLMMLEAQRLREDASLCDNIPLIAGVIELRSPDELKSLFAILTKDPAVVLLGGILPLGGTLMFGCHKECAKAGLREIFREAIDAIGGRGGGSDIFCQGTSPDAAAATVQEAIWAAKRQLEDISVKKDKT
jgi:alanyl-tRNA synthetase